MLGSLQRWSRLLAFSAMLMGCTDKRAAPSPRPVLMVRVRTNMAQQDFMSTKITVRQDGHLPYETDAPELPFLLALLSGAEKSPHVTIDVTAAVPNVVPAVVLGFHQSLNIPENWEQELDAKLTKPASVGAPGQRTLAADPDDTTQEVPLVPALARLDMKIDGLCTVEVRDACSADETCVAGRCVAAELEYATLPLVLRSDVAPRTEGDAAASTCFAPLTCLQSAVAIEPGSDCSVTAPAGKGNLNLALERPASPAVGYCDAQRCLLPLEQGEGLDWSLVDDLIVLSPRLCDSTTAQSLPLVAARSALEGCESKRPSVPFCPPPDVNGAGGGGGSGGTSSSGAGGDTTGGDATGGSSVVDVKTQSSDTSYLVKVPDDVWVYPLLTQGDSIGTPPYNLAGAALGVAALDNGGKTFSLLVSHDIAAGENGGSGAFVSRWDLQTDHLSIDSGANLATTVQLWEPMSATYLKTASAKTQLSRLGPADLLSKPSLLVSGEMDGQESRAFAFDLDHNAWEVPRLGKANWGSLVSAPATGTRTVIAGTDNTENGQLYFYVGNKLTSGSTLDKAGLSNGVLYGLVDIADEGGPSNLNNSFKLQSLGDVSTYTGAQLESASFSHFLTQFIFPAGGAWDPTHPADYYFVTGSIPGGQSRLWRLRFKNAADITLGGQYEILLNGTEGQIALHALTIDGRGHIYLLESPGADERLSRVLRLDSGNVLTPILQADAARFGSGGANFISDADDLSAIFDASSVLEPGWFFLTMQVNAGNSGSSVTRGQLLAFYDPRSAVTP